MNAPMPHHRTHRIRGAEPVSWADRVLKKKRRPIGLHHPIRDFRDFQIGAYGLSDPLKLTLAFEGLQEVLEVAVGHLA